LIGKRNDMRTKLAGKKNKKKKKQTSLTADELFTPPRKGKKKISYCSGQTPELTKNNSKTKPVPVARRKGVKVVANSWRRPGETKTSGQQLPVSNKRLHLLKECSIS